MGQNPTGVDKADVPSDTPGWPDQQFPLPPPGELNDDPAEFTGKWGPSGMEAALELASQPNYLGSPDVVNALTGELLTAAVDQQIDSTKKSEFTTARKKIARAVSGEDTSYTTMPAWHCKEALGRHLVECFGFDTNFCAGES